jgi:hypothetical protein
MRNSQSEHLLIQKINSACNRNYPPFNSYSLQISAFCQDREFNIKLSFLENTQNVLVNIFLLEADFFKPEAQRKKGRESWFENDPARFCKA